MRAMQLWTDFDLPLDVDDVLRGQGADPEVVRSRRPALVAAAERALDEGRSRLHPAALVREVDVVEQRHERLLLEDGFALTGPLVARHLGGAHYITAVIATIGPHLELLATRTQVTDPVLAMALDGLGNAAVELVGQQACGRISNWARSKGLQVSTPLSPGSPEWTVETGQPQIFALLDAAQAGVQVTDGGMMLPQKTISFVSGIGTEMSQVDPCEICSLRGVCRFRND